MKTSFYIPGLILFVLSTLLMVGYSGEEPSSVNPQSEILPTHEERLAGEYELTKVEVNVISGLSVSVRPPFATGTLALIHRGSLYVSGSLDFGLFPPVFDLEWDEDVGKLREIFTDGILGLTFPRTFKIDEWEATATHLVVAGETVNYTLQGSVLKLNGIIPHEGAEWNKDVPSSDEDVPLWDEDIPSVEWTSIEWTGVEWTIELKKKS